MGLFLVATVPSVVPAGRDMPHDPPTWHRRRRGLNPEADNEYYLLEDERWGPRDR